MATLSLPSARKLCKTCRYFVPGETFGACHYHPVTNLGFPRIMPDDWCGQHRKPAEAAK